MYDVHWPQGGKIVTPRGGRTILTDKMKKCTPTPSQDLCQPPKSSPCWSFALKTHISSLRFSILNRSMAQPLAPSWPTFSWKSLNLRSLVLATIPIYASGMKMTLLSSNRQNTATNSSSISIQRTHTFHSPQKTPMKVVPYLSWIPLFHQDSTIP